MKIEELKVIYVCGAGTMGQGITQVMAQQGYQVFWGDVKQEFIDAGIDRIKGSLQKLTEKGRIGKDEVAKAISLITGTIDINAAARNADLIIEAIPEKLELKSELFRQLDKVCKEEAILATNTSTLSITELATATRAPERFIGMHFFNPAPLMKLVEIVNGLLTSNETSECIRTLVLKLGKEPVIVTDSPGFVANRLGIRLFLEASRVLEEHVASVADIDKTMRLGWGARMGPFETCDLVGLDARLNNLNALYEATRDPTWKPPKLLKQLVSAGYLGKKRSSKGGYYTYFGLEE